MTLSGRRDGLSLLQVVGLWPAAVCSVFVAETHSNPDEFAGNVFELLLGSSVVFYFFFVFIKRSWLVDFPAVPRPWLLPVALPLGMIASFIGSAFVTEMDSPPAERPPGWSLPQRTC